MAEQWDKDALGTLKTDATGPYVNEIPRFTIPVLTAGFLGAVVDEGQNSTDARLAEIERRILELEGKQRRGF